MAVQTSTSFAISFLSAVLIFSALQFGKHFFLSSQFLTILAGGIGSWFFITSLTAVSNLEAMLLGKGFHARWFPEVLMCLLAACFACSTIHRVAVTSCLVSSFVALYYLNKISQRFHTAPTAVVDSVTKKKKK